jgi:2-polyprenyl-3-methyl-5-hydroxy-6-metoxy-1,4-benzoquinol methylase
MTEMIVNYHFLDTKGTFGHFDKSRYNFQEIYATYLSLEPAIGGRVLDIGCGHGLNPTVEKIAHLLRNLDGVDPFPVMTPPMHLVNRWECPLEDIPTPSSTYDMAYSYNVVEHVKDALPFLRKAIDLLKPGGVYWSMSPNSRHPFTWVTILTQICGLTTLYRSSINSLANNYRAYYKMSNDNIILAAIRNGKIPVSQVDFYYIPNVHWDCYFPKLLRFVPHAIDKMILLHKPKASFIFMFRIQKAST